jgi:GDPmannose 4,6-dehydratase
MRKDCVLISPLIALDGPRTVRDFLQCAFEHTGLDWQTHVKFDDRYLRPTEVDSLIGDPSKAAQVLGWKPGVLTPELAAIMVDADISALGQPRL